jgi:hypothetical protein
MGFAPGSGSYARGSRPGRVSTRRRVGSESPSEKLAPGEERRVALASELEKQNQNLRRIISQFLPGIEQRY